MLESPREVKMRTAVSIYIENSKEAVQLYLKAFGLELGYHVLNDDGSYYHSELYKEGKEMLSVIEAKGGKREHTTQISMIMDSKEEVRHAFESLREGSTVKLEPTELPWSPLGAVLTDRFGVWWYITAPQYQPDDSFDPKTYKMESLG